MVLPHGTDYNMHHSVTQGQQELSDMLEVQEQDTQEVHPLLEVIQDHLDLRDR